MTKLRRLLRNVPVLLLLAVSSAVFLASPALGPPAFAAETLGTDLPPGFSPEQAEAAKKLLQTNEAARKALEAAKPPLEQQAPKPAGAAAEVAKKDPAGAVAAALPRYDWRKSSYVGGLFSKRLTESEAATISHFGHELFTPSSGAQLTENIPVGSGYIVGPGDEIIVKMWGRVEGTQRMTVDRDGKIFFPKFGALYVAGMTFEEMRAFLKAKVSTIAEVSSDVTLGQMKGIRVSVVGEVRAPGWYNVSSFQTALQALSMAGGMKDIGSLRRIKILRGGKEIQEIDLYNLLLAGDTRADIRLQQGDVIFVPVVARLVAIAGEVRRPAIYELRNEKSLLDLVLVAGGFAPSAWKQRVQVERLFGNVSRVVLDASAEELEKGKAALDLSDGDIVRVFPIVQADLNVVTLEGNVYRPGKYEVKPGMTVGSLLKDVTDFLPETYFEYALLTRLVPPDLHKEVIPVNLREVVLEKKPGTDIALQGRDTLTVYNRSSFRDLPKVTISGEVRLASVKAAPGAKTGKDFQDVLTLEIQAGMRVADLVRMAGGLTRLAYLERAEFVRVDPKRGAFRTTYFDLGKAMAGDEKENLVLEDGDQVIVRQIPDWPKKIVVTLSGEVQFPGVYTATKGERLSALITRAGGFKNDAYLKAALFTRASTQKTQQEAIDKLIDGLELDVAQKSQQVGGAIDAEDVAASKELMTARRNLIDQLKKTKAKGRVIIQLADNGKLEGTIGDILLEDGDALDVPKKMNVVNVVGRVYNPTGVVFDPARDSVGHYLGMVGGPTESADRAHIFLLKADGSVVTQDTSQSGFFVFGERGLMNAKVEPGDSILVPEKLVQVRVMKDVKDITQILMQIAVTAGVLIALF